MFALKKFAYFACNESAREWYDTTLKHKINIDLQYCCEKLLTLTTTNRDQLDEIGLNICNMASKFGHLDCLTYAHILGLKWNEETCSLAAENGNLEILKFAHNNGCLWDENTCLMASKNGHLDILKYADENGCQWHTSRTDLWAAENGHLDVLKYIHLRGFPLNFLMQILACMNGNLNILEYTLQHGLTWIPKFCSVAAERGHLNIVKFAYENKFKWNKETCLSAAKNGHLDVLMYAHKHGCSWDPENVCSLAARNGHINVLKYAYSGNKFNLRLCDISAVHGHLHIFKFAEQNGCQWDLTTCALAAINGKTNILKYVHQHKCPWNDKTCSFSVQNEVPIDISKYVQKNGCPWSIKSCTLTPKNENIELPNSSVQAEILPVSHISVSNLNIHSSIPDSSSSPSTSSSESTSSNFSKGPQIMSVPIETSEEKDSVNHQPIRSEDIDKDKLVCKDPIVPMIVNESKENPRKNQYRRKRITTEPVFPKTNLKKKRFINNSPSANINGRITLATVVAALKSCRKTTKIINEGENSVNGGISREVLRKVAEHSDIDSNKLSPIEKRA